MKLAILLVLTVLAYQGIRHNGFVYEDDALRLQALVPPSVFLTANHRPLTVLSLWLDRQVFGNDPLGWHLTNLALHLLNGVLVYLLVANLLSGSVAWIAAGLFLLHPIQVEAVAYLNGRSELLSACGILTCVWASTLEDEALGGTLAILGAVVAVVSKESAVVLVGLMPLLWTIQSRRATLPAYLVVIVAGAFALGPALDLMSSTPQSILEWAGLQATAIWRYLLMVPLPDDLAIEHDWAQVASNLRLVLLATWLVVPLACWWERIPSRVLFGVLWVWICLLPRLVVPLPNAAYLAEHQVYLAFVGVWIVIASCWQTWAEGPACTPA